MDFTELKDLVMSLKLKDELGGNDLIVILDSKSPKGTNGALKVIKGNAFKPELTKKDLESLKKDIDKQLATLKQPKTIIVDNSELEKRFESEIKALEKRFEDVKTLKVDLRDLDSKFTSLTIPKDVSEDLQALNTDYDKSFSEILSRLKILEGKPTVKQVNLAPIESQLTTFRSKINELNDETKTLSKKSEFNLSEILKLQTKPKEPQHDYSEDINALQAAFTTSLKEIKQSFLSTQEEIRNLNQQLTQQTSDTNAQVQSLSKQIAELQNTKQLASKASQQAKVALDKLRAMDKENVN